jgi:hypothetical protein
VTVTGSSGSAVDAAGGPPVSSSPESLLPKAPQEAVCGGTPASATDEHGLEKWTALTVGGAGMGAHPVMPEATQAAWTRGEVPPQRIFGRGGDEQQHPARRWCADGARQHARLPLMATEAAGTAGALAEATPGEEATTRW